jgi:hypothetical protein
MLRPQHLTPQAEDLPEASRSASGRVAAAPASYSPYPSYSGGYASNLQYPYTLDSGDRLRIVVFGQEGLTNSYVLDASGQIHMPLIGAVAARGLTTDQLSERIAEMLRQGFIREPHVAVEIEGYRPFFILGEVTQPGQYPYVANMTVETAVAIAGGFGPRGCASSHHQPQFRRPGDALRGAGVVSDPPRRYHPGAGALVLAGIRLYFKCLAISGVEGALARRHGGGFVVAAALFAIKAVLRVGIDVDFAIAAALLLDDLDIAHRN